MGLSFVMGRASLAGVQVPKTIVQLCFNYFVFTGFQFVQKVHFICERHFAFCKTSVYVL
jgi:hypothetical protein